MVEGVPSALAAVTVRLHFSTAPGTSLAPQPPNGSEECKVGLLEWLPEPLRFEFLPPEDQTSRSGFAQVPMPILDAGQAGSWKYDVNTSITGNLPGLRFEAHPERFRALKMTWNQGPSGASDHPIELHAKYQLFEFDVDAKTAESLDIPAGKQVDVADWVRQAGMRLRKRSS